MASGSVARLIFTEIPEDALEILPEPVGASVKLFPASPMPPQSAPPGDLASADQVSCEPHDPVQPVSSPPSDEVLPPPAAASARPKPKYNSEFNFKEQKECSAK